ncbi:uncharacterized protein LOC121695341 [Alosa sapidissima]|uniref:uncharacterized protein LOC121695341 n=1 Tax=Alosa sapidissima TaxID=34773 RepID=UPI001C097CEB|nr:uncharacterized protein LOC121695341 [Alosa sapidissima]XP_041932013.1 uncharacterized protein LOC121695341 [Alosa sapidissima]
MGNTVSCCFRANPGDRQEEGQRLQNVDIKHEVAPRRAADSAVEKSILLYQQEVAAGLVPEDLADTTKIVASKYLDEVTLNLDVPLAKLCTKAVFMEKPETLGCSVNVEAQNVSVEITETTLPMTPVREEVFNTNLPVEHVIEEASSKMVNISLTDIVQANNDKNRTLKDFNLREELCSGDNMNSSLPSATAEKDVQAEIRGSAAKGLSSESLLSDLLEGQETPERSQIPEQDKLVVEAKSEPLGYSDTMPGSTPLMTPSVKKAASAEPQQHLVRSNCSLAEESARCISIGFDIAHPGDHSKEEASSEMVNTTKGLMITSMQPSTKDEDGVDYDDIILHGGISTEETVDDAMLPQEDLATNTPAVKLEDRLVQNPSAEGVVNKAPKGFSLVSEIDAHLDMCGHQSLLDSSKALDDEQDVPLHSSEDERLLTSAMLGTGFPFINAKLAEAISQHRSDSGHSISMEGQPPVSGLDLNSVPTDACARGCAAASAAQDVVFGLSTKSSLGNLLEGLDTPKRSQKKQGVKAKSVPLPKLLAELAELQKVVVSSTGSTDGGLAVNLQDERPGSAGRWSPVSDGSEAWFTCGEDLYYSEEEIEEELARQSVMEMTVPEQDRCSFEPPVGILIHSEREWKEQTTESIIIRNGYAVLSQSFGFVRRVREDNYCALRASLYQTLMSSAQLPDWLQRESFLLIPDELETRYGLIKGWLFPDVCKQTSGIKDDVDLMKHYLSLLRKWWHAAAASPGLEGRRRVCEQLFQGGGDEFGVMEALKLLMLACAVELHAAMERGKDVPIFCWLLFSRYTSSCPRTFLANHLSQVGFSGGMEQVEMCLLGYTLHHTIKVYRLYMANMADFIITHYPDDHIQDWPSVCLVTEDGRHYNVAVGEPACPQEDLSRGPH